MEMNGGKYIVFLNHLSGPRLEAPNSDVTPGISDNEIEKEEQRREPRLKNFEEAI